MQQLLKVYPASQLSRAAHHVADSSWQFSALVGFLTELSSHGSSAATTLAMRLAWEAQCQAEPIAWVMGRGSTFYPPDALTNGLDLEALAIVRVPDPQAIGKAVDCLVRSGAFGLVVIDLYSGVGFSERQLTRLQGLARKHGTALVFLTTKPESASSLGSLISLRGQVYRKRLRPGIFACELRTLKDKRHAPGWRHMEVCHGPAGLR
ncbi:hypothetical protein D3C87_1327230 [compost metagenome]